MPTIWSALLRPRPLHRASRHLYNKASDIMKQLFTPAIALMNRLTYPRKFVLISLLLVAPLALALTFLILSIDTGVGVARLELQGNAYLRPLRKLMEHALRDN